MKDTHVNQIPEIANDATSVDAIDIANWVSRHDLSKPSSSDSGSKPKDSGEGSLCGAGETNEERAMIKQSFREQVLTPEELLLLRSYQRKQRAKQLELFTTEERAANSKYNNAICDKTPEYTLRSMYSNAKNNAKRRSISWEITLNEFIELTKVTTHCSVLGYELVYQSYSGKGTGQTNPRKASLDRIDSSKGYTLDNVRIVSWKYNCLKMCMSDDELLECAKAIVAYHEKQVPK